MRQLGLGPLHRPRRSLLSRRLSSFCLRFFSADDPTASSTPAADAAACGRGGVLAASALSLGARGLSRLAPAAAGASAGVIRRSDRQKDKNWQQNKFINEQAREVGDPSQIPGNKHVYDDANELSSDDSTEHPPDEPPFDPDSNSEGSGSDGSGSDSDSEDETEEKSDDNDGSDSEDETKEEKTDDQWGAGPKGVGNDNDVC